MAHDPRSEVHLAAQLDAPSSQPVDDRAFRIAIVGDFGARAQRGGAESSPLDRRRAWRVDRDDVDSALAAIAPELRLSIGPDEPTVVMSFASLDDFHPDRLAERLPLFQRLRALRAQAAQAPSGVRRESAPGETRRPGTDAVARDLSGGSLLDRILDTTAGEQPASSREPDDLGEFVDRAVRQHLVSEPSAQQRDLAAKVDDVIAATMRVLLHHPSFQALESLWRGVDFLVRRLDTSESMQVVLFDVSREELSADLAGPVVERSSLARLLSGGALGPSGAAGWSLLVGAYTFGPGDLDLLARLASLGRGLRAPWLAAAHPRLAGTEAFANGADPDDWNLSLPEGWDALRAHPDASFVGLALPRFLLRVPYGADSDECGSFAFEELAGGTPDHDAYLWGNPALLCALAIGSAVADGEAPPTNATVERMPLYVARVDGEPTTIPCAEALLGQRAVVHLVDRGLTALATQRDGDAVFVPRLQSLAMPPRPLSISRGLAG